MQRNSSSSLAHTLQEDEIASLQAIYGTEDFHKEKPVWGNASFRLTLKTGGFSSKRGQEFNFPSETSSSVQVQLELYITYTGRYPHTAPTIDVRPTRGGFTLSQDEIKTVKTKLMEKAELLAKSKTEPFLFDLIGMAQDALVEKSKVLMQATEKPRIKNVIIGTDSANALTSSLVVRKMLPDLDMAEEWSEEAEALAKAKKRELTKAAQDEDVNKKQEPPSPGVDFEPPSKTSPVMPVDLVHRLPPLVPLSSTTALQQQQQQQQQHKGVGRYATDFEELEAVGRGGFGQVVKARNRLDGMIYAVKKILLAANDAQNRRTIREVTLLAKLVHPNIVRYFVAWLEDADENDMSLGFSDDDDEESEDEFSVSEPSISRPTSSAFGTYALHDDEESDSGDSDILNDDSDSGGWDETSPKKTNAPLKRQPSPRHAFIKNQCLYISMEFVPRTLRGLIDSNDLLFQHDRCFELLREILEALCCVHDLKIQHRDIKPENILIDAQGKVKLGDFGLAEEKEEVANPEDLIKLNSNEGNADQGGVGTTYYRAPEVDGHFRYDEKCDVFSLGVVMVEMFSPPPATGMERHQILTALRLEPPMLPSPIPLVAADLAKRMLKRDPKSRPSAAEALRSIPGHVLVENNVDVLMKTVVSSSNAYHRLVKHLLSQTPSKEVDSTYDFDATSESEGVMEESLKTASSRARSELAALNGLPPSESLVPVTHEMRSSTLEQAACRVFHVAGAVRFRAPVLLPKTQFLWEHEHRKKVSTMLDSQGIPVELAHHTLTRSFARFVALNREVHHLKRFDCGYVFSRAGGGGQPIRTLQLCMDQVAPLEDLNQIGASTALFSEFCESARDVLHAADVLRPPSMVTIELGHTKLLALLFDMVKVPQECRSSFLQIVKSKEPFFRDYKDACDALTGAPCFCPISSVQALKFCLPIGKRLWMSGVGEVPTVGGGSGGGGAGAKESKEQPKNPKKEPLEELIDHVQGAFPKAPECGMFVFLVRELEQIGKMLASNNTSQQLRERFVFWCESPHDVWGLFFKATIRSGKFALRSGTGKNKAIYYEEGKEFVAADGGRFDKLMDEFGIRRSKRMLAGMCVRVYADRIALKRAFQPRLETYKRPTIRFCYPTENDTVVFECADRAKAASKLRAELSVVGVEWMHPVGMSGDAMLALCRESGARAAVSKVGPDAWRIRGWALNVDPQHAGSQSGVAVAAQQRDQLESLKLGAFHDKRFESWGEMVKHLKKVILGL